MLTAAAAGLIAGGINAGAGLLGGALNYGYNKSLQNSAQQFSAQEAQKQRDWTEEMSKTQYQRAVADLKASGLNPALAYSQGGSAASGGAAASGTSGSVGSSDLRPGSDFVNVLRDQVSTAAKERMLDRELDSKERIAQIYAAARQNSAETYARSRQR